MTGFCGFDCGYGPNQSFTCATCGNEVCYCDGANDEFPDDCSLCWQKHRLGIRINMMRDLVDVARETNDQAEKFSVLKAAVACLGAPSNYSSTDQWIRAYYELQLDIVQIVQAIPRKNP